VCFDHMHILKVSGCSNFEPIPFFYAVADNSGSLFLNATFGHGNMTCWPKCNFCVLEAKIWYV
jgi:hypothetical protein